MLLAWTRTHQAHRSPRTPFLDPLAFLMYIIWPALLMFVFVTLAKGIHNYQDKKSRRDLLQNGESQWKLSKKASGPQLSLRTKSLAALWGIDYRKEGRWSGKRGSSGEAIIWGRDKKNVSSGKGMETRGRYRFQKQFRSDLIVNLIIWRREECNPWLI